MLSPRPILTPGDERRADRRYALDAPLQYKIIQAGKAVFSGAGRLVNISHGGLLFECAEEIEPGNRVELDVDWPADAVRIVLNVVGQTVRRQEARTAVKILRCSFRDKAPADVASCLDASA